MLKTNSFVGCYKTVMIHPNIKLVQDRIEPLRKQLLEHPVYAHIDSLSDLQNFMEHHVYAVWDFMSLAKALQRALTCVDVPWVPKGNPVTRRLINEIIMGEESDVDQEGVPASHYELYIEAMDKLKADIVPIETLVENIRSGQTVHAAIEHANLSPNIAQFLKFTFEVIATNKPHLVAAVFTFGREDLIPDMFTAIINDLNKHYPDELHGVMYYLERHVEVDGDTHGPMALQMISELCGDDQEKWDEVLAFSERALSSRLELWDGILAEVQNA